MKFSAGLLAAFLFLGSVKAQANLPSQSEVQDMSAKGYRLLFFGEEADLEWHTDDQILYFRNEGTNFADVTEVYQEGEPLVAERLPTVTYAAPSHQASVTPIISTLKIDNLKTYVGNLTAFNNRYYRASTGEQATQWVIKTIQAIISASNSTATVSRFSHSFTMGSVIAKFPGTGSSKSVTILGAHLDSINARNPTSGAAPGADDDASGSANLIEAFRALVAAGFKPSSPVEFHWYAGEEGGLLGSQDIAKSYSNSDVDVKAMLQLDMTAYFKPGTTETISLIPDYVDSGLTTFVGQLVDAYSTLDHDTSPKCGYACSDHASWYNAGYPSSFPFETRYGEDNPAIHSTSDTVTATGYSFTHSFEYTKLAVAFAYELGA